MRRITRAAAAATLVLVSGCASVTTSGSSSSDSPPLMTPSPSLSPGGDRAVSVVFERAGGKTGRREVRRFAADAPPPRGTSSSRLKQVLSIASRPGVRSLHLPRMPQMLCCDRYTYTVRVMYADGIERIFRTADGLSKPPPLRRLISLVS